jgi:hypothetical protein
MAQYRTRRGGKFLKKSLHMIGMRIRPRPPASDRQRNFAGANLCQLANFFHPLNVCSKQNPPAKLILEGYYKSSAVEERVIKNSKRGPKCLSTDGVGVPGSFTPLCLLSGAQQNPPEAVTLGCDCGDGEHGGGACNEGAGGGTLMARNRHSRNRHSHCRSRNSTRQ